MSSAGEKPPEQVSNGPPAEHGSAKVPGSSAEGAGAPVVPPLDVFVLAHGARLLGYVRQIFPAALKQRYDPLDLYQTTVFEAFRRADTFRHVSDESTLAWLFVLARRQVGMAVRNERRAKRGGGRREARLDDTDAVQMVEALAAHRRTPSQSAARHEVMVAVERALGELPPHLAEAVRLRHLEGLSPAEVGQRMGRTERAAATLCFRGLRLLQRKLRSLSRYT